MRDPLALEVALQVQAELQGRLAEADRLRQQHVQRSQYEADQARVRYLRVDPNNRLVADTLETQWNDKLRSAGPSQGGMRKTETTGRARLSAEQKAKVLALASDFPKLWNDAKTPDRERKRWPGCFWKMSPCVAKRRCWCRCVQRRDDS